MPKEIKFAIAGFSALIIFILLIMSVKVIPSSTVGIKSRFNIIIGDSPLESGWHLKWFFDDIEIVDLKQVQKDFPIAGTQTIDLQPTTIAVKVAYTIPKEMVIRNRKEIDGDLFLKIIAPRAQEVIRDEVSKYPAEQLITSRSKLIEGIRSQLSVRVKEHAIIQDVTITEMDFADQKYKQAISDKVIVKELANKAVFETQKIQEEAKQKMVQAKATADAQLIIAKAEAEGLKIKSQAVAQNPKLIDFEIIKAQVEINKIQFSPESKWNGKLPDVLVIGGDKNNNSTTPVILPINVK